MRLYEWLIGIGVLCEEETPKFKTRVVPFTEACNYYVVQWSNNGGRSWENLTEAWMPFYGDHRRWSLDQPVMEENFDKAVEIAKRFKTMEDVEKHLAAEKLKCKAAWDVKEQQRTAKVKVWESE